VEIIRTMLQDEGLTREIIGSAIEVHRALGPGLLERVYQDALECELLTRGLVCVREQAVPIRYKGRLLPNPMRIDILVENRVILEVKSVREVLDVHRAQLMTYLKLRGGGIGFLLNFNVARMIDGVIRRAV
jgi:GxxExxY protein